MVDVEIGCKTVAEVDEIVAESFFDKFVGAVARFAVAVGETYVCLSTEGDTAFVANHNVETVGIEGRREDVDLIIHFSTVGSECIFTVAKARFQFILEVEILGKGEEIPVSALGADKFAHCFGSGFKRTSHIHFNCTPE